MTRKSPLSFHVDAANVDQVWLNRVLDQVSGILLMDPSPAMIRAAAKKLDTLIVRRYDPYGEGLNHDGTFHMRHAPAKVAQWTADTYGEFKNHKNIFWIIGYNEPPAPEDRQPFAHQVDWFLSFAEEMKKRGFNSCIFEINVPKSIRTDGNGNYLDMDQWDRVLKYLHENPETCKMGVHDYTLLVPWLTKVPNFMHEMVHSPRNIVYAQRPAQGPSATNANGWWYALRWLGLWERAKQRGWTNARFAVTECLLDHMNEEGIRNAYNAAKAVHGMPEYDFDLRGAPSVRRFFDKAGVAFFEQELFDHAVWWWNMLPTSNVDVICWFARNNSSHWRAYNTRVLPIFESLMMSYREREIPVELQEGEIKVLLNNSNVATWNIRANPTTSARILGKIRSGTYPVKLNPQTVDAGNYRWLQILAPGESQAGWLAIEYLPTKAVYTTFKTLDAAPPPVEPDPPAEPDPDHLYVDYGGFTYRLPIEFAGQAADLMKWLSEMPGASPLKDFFLAQEQFIRSWQK